jgi:hypothetical protein
MSKAGTKGLSGAATPPIVMFQDFFRRGSTVFIGVVVAREHTGSMYGFIPQQSNCPHCGIKRTLRMGFSGTSICMNCRARWGTNSSTSSEPASNQPAVETQQTFPFSPAELARLRVYRRAVAAGFYTDALNRA